MAVRSGDGGEGGKGGGRGADDDLEDDDDIVCGVNEDYRKHIDALKRACVLEVGLGGYITTPASILSSKTPAFNEDDGEGEQEEEDDDDEVLASIRTKYGSKLDTEGLGGHRKGTPGEAKNDAVGIDSEDDEEEDDEEILRSVEQMYTNGRKNIYEEPSLQITPPRKDGGTKEIHQRTSPPAAEECEPGDEIGSFEPSGSPNAVEEPAEEAPRPIASFLPGSWSDTEEDEQFGGANPAAASENPPTEYLDNNPDSTTVGNGKGRISDDVTVALQKNRQCQRTLKNVMSQLEAKMKVNAEMQRRVKTLVEFKKQCDRRFAGFLTDQANPSVKLISAKTHGSQHKSTEASEKVASEPQTCGPPENPDVEIYRKLQQKVSFAFNSRRWSKEERIELAKGVKQQVYEIFVRQAMDDISNDVLDEGFDDLDDRMNKIRQKELTAHETRAALPLVDWAEVARLYVVGHTPGECKSRWMNHEDPLINKGPWRKIEDKRLLSIAQTQDFSNWETIAQELGTDRTPAECLTRYQRSLNASIMRRGWTREEDDQLRAAVEEWGENDWSAVAACIEGRNNSQCLMRWYKVLHPTKKKSGRWSVEEDKRLKWAVSVYGPRKWKKIAEHVPGRTDLQCRERWCNVLDPGIKLGEWTAEEDQNLEASVARHGLHRWAAVANDLKIRTDNQCCRRWKALHPEDQAAIQRNVHIRRIALAGNFQGRKKERPRLGPQDFISRSMDIEDSRGMITANENSEGGNVAELRSKANVMPFQSKSPRTCRAERIQKRRAARARQLYKSGTAQGGQLDGEPRNGTEENGQLVPHREGDAALNFGERGNFDRGPKRKCGSRNNPSRPHKRANLQVSKTALRTNSQELQSNKPHISSFLELVCSVRDYCTYVDHVARDEARSGLSVTSNANEISKLSEATFDVAEDSREPGNKGDIHTGNRVTVDDVNHGSPPHPQPVDSMHGEGGSQLSGEDEEVAAAAKAALSWPFFSGVQKFWSQGTTYLRSKDPSHGGRTTTKKTNEGPSHGLGVLTSFVKKPRSKRAVKRKAATPVKMRGAIPQASSALGAQMLTED